MEADPQPSDLGPGQFEVGFRHVLWTDAQGLVWRRAIPERMPDEEAQYGAPAGPPDLRQIAVTQSWPQEFLERLHGQLVARELWDAMALKRAGGRTVLLQALHSAMKSDLHVLETAFGSARRPRRQ